MGSKPIYMDHHATTPVDPRVVEAMLPYLGDHFGNAASTAHAFGRAARDATELGRAQVAALLDCRPDELVFTSGATESDNLAIAGVARALESAGKHLVTVRTEHKAVVDCCAALERDGWRVSYLDVDAEGRVAPDAVREALTDETVLVSVMLANNEVGVVQDVAAIGAVARERGVLFHCDAAQGLGYLPLSTQDMPVDLVSLSAHKMYGPKGIGALYVRRTAQARGVPAPLVHGGGHEFGLRSGTLNVPGIVGFGVAAEILTLEGPQEADRIAKLRDSLERRISNEVDETRLNGDRAPRHPGNLNMSFRYVDGAALLRAIGEHVAVSSGAACSSATPGPSYVLEAMGVPDDEAAASIRFGLGRSTTEADIARAGDVVVETVAALRAKSPAWRRHTAGKPVDW
ncbi:MAG: cysteine desulfurase family protein [Myxococcota bacterium]